MVTAVNPIQGSGIQGNQIRGNRIQCVVGIDLGSTTTKAVVLDLQGNIIGRGITNSRSNYEVAAAVARDEALTAVRFSALQAAMSAVGGSTESLGAPLTDAFRLELYRAELRALRAEIAALLEKPGYDKLRSALAPAVDEILDGMDRDAASLFVPGAERKSDFFRDLAGAAFVRRAEELAAAEPTLPFERLVGLYDRAILDVETRMEKRDFGALLTRAADRVLAVHPDPQLRDIVLNVGLAPISEVAFVGTGYGRQTLPFPKETVRSEILCHGRGAHRVFPGTRTVLDIGGQDTKAIQVDDTGVVTSFQMNDRCAAGCGRYLGYIADELNLGLHELGPLALQAKKQTRVNSTCTVFAGAELRDRLALGQRREDILAGLHRAIMLRAMSILARSGGVLDQFTFTGGVCNNPMAVKVLRELVGQNYGDTITVNTHSSSIYMGALGAAMYGLDDHNQGRGGVLPTFAQA